MGILIRIAAVYALGKGDLANYNSGLGGLPPCLEHKGVSMPFIAPYINDDGGGNIQIILNQRYLSEVGQYQPLEYIEIDTQKKWITYYDKHYKGIFFDNELSYSRFLTWEEAQALCPELDLIEGLAKFGVKKWEYEEKEKKDED